MSSILPPLESLHGALETLAREAGRIALADFSAGSATHAEVRWKAGGSPVTSADLAVDAFLADALPRLAPLAYHSEERPESWRGAASGAAFVVDPIDGTRDFSRGGDAWCIVIGVIENGTTMAGAVHVPARGITYSAFLGGGAFRNGERLQAPVASAAPLRATGPRPVMDMLERHLGQTISQADTVPALAHRVLLPLGGDIDLALARAGGHDWDIVASDCILREAGCALVTLEGRRPDYGLTGQEHPPLVAASASLLEKLGLLEKPGLSGKKPVSLLTNPV